MCVPRCRAGLATPATVKPKGCAATCSGVLCFVEGDDHHCGRRVVCGGSWNNNPNNLRSANRNRNNTDNRNNNIGFRLLLQSAP
ncbi:hypothetical protein D5085_04175 [Ectothiorhodospiraceae bacterium BW-2]|nr:hypothetical protein D5085_04175 [Ectothiorhodospiraceae bacterium BW-2]